jgi:Flp pilus assembly protein TadG
MRNRLKPRSQRGAVIITVALMMLFLLGFMGAAIDLGRLFIVRAELQTALDSCALAAAQELDRQSTALTRARNAGRTAGNLNRVNLQSATWSGQGQIVDDDITFFDSSYTATGDSTQAIYARCAHTQPNINLWLLQAMGAFVRNAAAYPSTASVQAQAVATIASAQSTCPLPIALKMATGSTGPMYGMTVGQWVTVLGSRTPGTGEWGWYNIDGSQNARQTKDQLEKGTCAITVDTPLDTPGVKTSVDVAWNYRFGIYKNSDSAADHHPDFSGYAYTNFNWPSGCCAYDGATPSGAGANATNFLTERGRFQPYGATLPQGSTEVFNQSNKLNGFQKVATAAELQQYGAYRRVAPVPVIDGTNRVKDFLCVFMLQPLTGPNTDTQVEIRGNASETDSPCVATGIPGGLAGPRVPVLVR